MPRAGKAAMLRASSVALAAGAALWAGAGRSQDPPAEDCTGLGDPATEIACLRDALQASRKALAEAEGKPPRAAPPVDGPPRPQAAPRADGAAALGDEQLPRAGGRGRDGRADPDRFQATVTASRTDPLGLLVVQLDNGQIWRQVDSTDLPVRLDAEQRTHVEITHSGFGGYRMSFPELGRRIAVSRLR